MEWLEVSVEIENEAVEAVTVGVMQSGVAHSSTASCAAVTAAPSTTPDAPAT